MKHERIDNILYQTLAAGWWITPVLFENSRDVTKKYICGSCSKGEIV